MQAILLIIVFVILGVGLPFVAYEGYNYFGPKYAATERKIFEETKSYNDGMIRDLENLMMQYQTAKPEQQEALKAVVIHRFSVYQIDKLPVHLQQFYTSLRGGY
jgi:hypothetical protein